MKAKMNTDLVIHLLLQQGLEFERKAREEFDRPDGTEDQSPEDKKFNRDIFNGRAEAFRIAAHAIHNLRVIITE